MKLTATGALLHGIDPEMRRVRGARPFHSLHATWQALQPVQMEVSTNIPFAIYAAPPFFPAWMLQVKTLPSWIETFGSATSAVRLFTTSPCARALPAPVPRQADLVDGFAVDR